MNSITAIFVAVGPGGFSALRVGLSTAKGIATANQIPLIGIGTLAIEAAPHIHRKDAVWAIIDAGRCKLYAGLFENLNGPIIQIDDGYQKIAYSQLQSIIGNNVVVCGEAVTGPAHERLRELTDHIQLIEEKPPTRKASTLARLAYQRLSTGEFDDPRTIQPIYMQSAQLEKTGNPILEKENIDRDFGKKK
jgi:tRNA threonylcarbamoyladenosine biosynthesis protein TsaB